MSDRSPFAHRDFRLLLLGQTTSQFGAQVGGIAVPLVAVVSLHASSLELGLITASSTLAFALVGLQAGAWLDRRRRRPVLIASDLARAVLLGTIPLAAILGLLTVAQLIVVSLLTGFARVFFDVGYQSYLPSVIGKDRMLAGNSTMETLRASGQVVGPGLGGALVSLVGAAAVVLIQSVTFAVSAAALLAIRTTEPVIPRLPDRPRLWPQIREGLVFVASNRVLRATAIASAAANFSFAISSAVAFIFMARTLQLTPAGIGLIVAAGSITVIAGAALTPRLSRLVGSARIIWVSLAVTAPVAFIGLFAQPGWWTVLIVISIAAGEFGQIVYAITNVTLRQRLCPDRMLGRVTATMRFLIMGLFPLGALIGGVLGGGIGLRGTLAVAGVVLMLCPIPLFLALRRIRHVEELPAWGSDPTELAGPVQL